MTKFRRASLITAAAAVITIMATGCVQGGTQPPPSPSASSPKPTPSSIAAPTSSDDAWVQANKTIASFTQIQYQIEHDSGADVDQIDVIATNGARSSMQQIASDLSAKGLKIIGGAPTWEPNAAASSFGTLIDSNGKSYPDGIVYARGCWDLSKQSSVASTGTPPPDRSVKVFPIQFNVAYSPELRTWRVTDQTNITGQSGAPQC
jgi:hypothetical protein